MQQKNMLFSALCLGSSLFAEQEGSQGISVEARSLPKAEAEQSLGVNLTADYIYWKWSQDTFQTGILVQNPSGPSLGSSTAKFQDPGYSSGFQVGAGFEFKGMESFTLESEYTWYKNQDSQTVVGTLEEGLALPKAAFTAYQAAAAGAFRIGAFQFNARIGFQSLDVLLGKKFRVGSRLKGKVSAGLKAIWMSQSFNWRSPSWFDLTNNDVITDWLRFSHQTTWSLGPKLGVSGDWMLGYGLKFISNGAVSLLYTSYNSISGYQTQPGASLYPTVDQKGLHNYGVLTPVLELFLGMGWCSYFCEERFGLDLSLGYDFNAYLDYNMIYSALSQVSGNMYLHGLNAKIRFDF